MAISCARCGASAGPDAAFCSACGAPLASETAERKLATLVFADLVGSTEMITGRDPEEVRGLLDPFYELARGVLEHHGGRVEKFIGDAVVAAFGVPRAHGDDPDRALAAALALVDRLAAHDPRLVLRIGIETGEVLAGPRGGELAVTGDVANAAARLQQAARPGEVLVGERAKRAIRAARLVEHPPIEAKGFSAPLPAWRAVGAADSGEETVEEAPFLGRGGELDQLRLAHLSSVRERRPRLVLLVGESGSGKTRLVRELIGELRHLEPAPTVIVGRNPPYGDGIAFWALGEILRDAAGAAPASSAAVVRELLTQRLAALGVQQAHDTAAVLAATLAADGTATESSDLRRAWRRLLSALADEAPVLLAIDDAHWADEGFLDLIDDAVSLPRARLTIICTARPEIANRRPQLGASEGQETLAVGPLAPAAASELAARLVGDADPALASDIAAASGGNPFFAEEIARSVADGSGDGRAEGLPDTVQAAIAARIDALPAPEKATLQRAAVLGDRFRVPALNELSEHPPESALPGLAARALVESREADEDGLYAFRHQLIRDVAYSSLTKAERARLHRRAADGVRGRAGERRAELSEVIAFHLAQAAGLAPSPELELEAYEATIDAAELAQRRGAAARAQELLEQAARLAPGDEARVEALVAAAEAALARIRGDQAAVLFRESGEVAERSGDRRAAAWGYARATEVATRMAGISAGVQVADAIPLLARAESIEPNPDPALQARLRLGDAWIAWRTYENERMAAAADQALALARAVGDPVILSSALDAASASAWNEGRFDDAITHSRERVETLGPIDALPGFVGFERSDALNMLVESLLHAGELGEAVRWADVHAVEMRQNAPHIAHAMALLPLYYLGEWDDAIRRARSVREAWVAEGRPPIAFFTPGLGCIGAIHGLRGDEAEQRDWLELAERLGHGGAQVFGVKLRAADVALHTGDLDAALEILNAPDRSHWAPMVLAKRAEALALGGRAGAAETLRRSVELGPGPGEACTVAVALRARGLIAGDDDILADACDAFERLGCAYELARTRWLRGGEHRVAAGATFERLGTLSPG